MRSLVVATALLVAGTATPIAAAQDGDGTGGSTGIGGDVHNTAMLAIDQSKTAFASFSSAKTYSTSFTVRATTTEKTATLSVADGDAASGSKRGHLTSGSKRMKKPLQARVGSAAFAPLDQAVDAQLLRLGGPLANREAKIDFHQQVTAKTKGSYRKVVLVTLTTDAP